jgi:hypothetical protein
VQFWYHFLRRFSQHSLEILSQIFFKSRKNLPQIFVTSMLLNPLHAWILLCESLTHFGALLVQPMCISWHNKKAIVHHKRHTIAQRFSEDSLNILLRFSSNLAPISVHTNTTKKSRWSTDSHSLLRSIRHSSVFCRAILVRLNGSFQSVLLFHESWLLDVLPSTLEVALVASEPSHSFCVDVVLQAV